jgi:hypothetical protein
VKRRLTSNLVGAAAIIAMACVDLSAPKGPSAISALQLPSTFVVAGDLMRDSLGNPAKPFIIGYDQNGNPIADVPGTFFFTDSIPFAHFENGIVKGDSVGTAHLVGQVGNLQTAVYNLPVTVAPFTIGRVLVNANGDTLKATAASDSAASLGTIPAQVKVLGVNATTGVPGVRVVFTLTKTLTSRTSSAAVFLLDDQGNLSNVDTTDVSGLASRKVAVVASFLADPALVAGTKTDSVVVTATATYLGVSLKGAPVRIVIPVKVGF